MAEYTFAVSGDSPADLWLRRPDVDTGVHHELAVGKRAPAILIAESAEIPRLKRKTGFGKDLLVFPDSESLRAHDAIMQHRPSLVVLSELFAKTRRGAELIGRIQTDVTLTHCQIRVLSDAGDYLLLVAERVTAGSSSTLEEPGKPLPPQYNGTRAAQRVRIGEGLEVRVDGNPVTLVDLSPTGAQVCLTAILRPYQRVRLVVVDGSSMFRFAASVVWVSFEPRKVKGPPQYRAGLGFVGADPDVVEALCVRYRPPGRPETAQLGKPSRHPLEPDMSATEPLPAVVGVVDEEVNIEEEIRIEDVALSEPSRHQPEPDVSATEPLPAVVAVVNEEVSIEEEFKVEDVTLSEPSRHPLEPDVSSAEPPQAVVEADVGVEKSRKPRRRAASLRELPSGTPVVIKRRGSKEEVVVLVRVKQTRFIAKDAAGRSVDLAVRDFLRPHLENRPT